MNAVGFPIEFDRGKHSDVRNAHKVMAENFHRRKTKIPNRFEQGSTGGLRDESWESTETTIS
jgi:hypothetical protein